MGGKQANMEQANAKALSDVIWTFSKCLFEGKDPDRDFTRFVDDFRWKTQLVDIPQSKWPRLFAQCLGGEPRDKAEEFIQEKEAAQAPPTDDQAASSAYGQRMFDDLITHLEKLPSVVASVTGKAV